MKVELGSGFHPTEGFVHVDANPRAPKLDYCCDVTDLSPIKTGTVTELLCVDVLEHISYRRVDEALAEWHRVCANGARMYVQVPDAQEAILWWFIDQAKLIDRIPDELPKTAEVGLQWRLLGGHDDGVYVDEESDWRWNAHYSLWTKDTLTLALADAGFEVESIVTNPHPNLCCWAIA